MCEIKCPRHRARCLQRATEHGLHFHGTVRERTLHIFGETEQPAFRGFDPNAHIDRAIIVREVYTAF